MESSREAAIVPLVPLTSERAPGDASHALEPWHSSSITSSTSEAPSGMVAQGSGAFAKAISRRHSSHAQAPGAHRAITPTKRSRVILPSEAVSSLVVARAPRRSPARSAHPRGRGRGRNRCGRTLIATVGLPFPQRCSRSADEQEARGDHQHAAVPAGQGRAGRTLLSLRPRIARRVR